MKPAIIRGIYCLSFYCIILSLLSACNSQKETVANRGMQNLTAHYNILYNANELIKESDRNIKLSYQDNYDRLISVYIEPDETLSQPENKKLDEAILKANTIINEKSQSKYVDDAYFIIAKANYLKSNFFNAAEFFTYIYQSYPKETEIKQAALAWKARTLLQLERFDEAKDILDTAFKYIETEKKSVSDIYATKAQLDLYDRKDEEAITMLKKAIRVSGNKQYRIRWTYLLAQLQELTGKADSAYANYTSIVKSNALFDMAFNANLNRISIEDQKSGRVINRIDRLKSLLKEDKNKDFIDQIYFQIANVYLSEDKLDKAIENYNTAIRKSIKNENQKGLSYLRLADIYFKNTDYLKSKKYYDSTLLSLSPNYPDYELIRKKSNNLELLANRLFLIAREDTLQMLARLPDSERALRIGVLVREQEEKTLSQTNPEIGKNPFSKGNSQAFETPKEGKYYFNNTTALSQGFSDFKKRWGNRKLEDNWRHSQKSALDITNNISNNPDEINDGVPDNPDAAIPGSKDLLKIFTENIPLTPEQKLASDHRIAAAYYDIGNYYRDVLNDEAEAIRNYELLIKRFPEDVNKLGVYYNLYRLYQTSNPQKSAEFKNILLTRYPTSPFAKVILDPEYNQKTDEQEFELNRTYNEIYNIYAAKNYSEVLLRAQEAEKKFGQNKLSPQLAYLYALALGHTQKLPQFENSLNKILIDFPEDKLVVPLIKQHLVYMETNRKLMGDRIYALLDNDQAQFIEEPVVNTPDNRVPNETIDSETIKPVTKVVSEISVKSPDKENPNKETPTKEIIATEIPSTANTDIPVSENIEQSEETSTDIPAKETTEILTPENSLFSLSDTGMYYFVVNVLDPSVNLSSSRFGIGQFNRTNFTGSGIKHQLKAINSQNQLIFVGEFLSKNEAADYFQRIKPLMSEIMKISANKYNTFYVSKQNLEKLIDRDMIDRYLEFYQKNF